MKRRHRFDFVTPDRDRDNGLSKDATGVPSNDGSRESGEGGPLESISDVRRIEAKLDKILLELTRAK